MSTGEHVTRKTSGAEPDDHNPALSVMTQSLPAGHATSEVAPCEGVSQCRFCHTDFSLPQRVNFSLRTPVRGSFRVEQIRAMFDLPVRDESVRQVDLSFGPLPPEWRIGLIVGPSGSGKSSLARWLFGQHLYQPGDWPTDCAVVDAFGAVSLKLLVRTLTAVGFSSPPAWLRPYAVLSTGEKARCDLARAVVEALVRGQASCGIPAPVMVSRTQVGPSHQLPLVVVDEFTSVVDRTVARAIAAALRRAISRNLLPCRFVAVTCHYDVVPWLCPDWVVDLATGTFQVQPTSRPSIQLELFRAPHSAWQVFAPHHYLTGNLSAAAQCFVACWEDRPVCFCALIPQGGRPGWRRISRLVILPEYQGLGIGSAVLHAVAEWLLSANIRTSITTSHPAMIAYLQRSAAWRITRRQRTGAQFRRPAGAPLRGRWVVSAEFWPPGRTSQARGIRSVRAVN